MGRGSGFKGGIQLIMDLTLLEMKMIVVGVWGKTNYRSDKLWKEIFDILR